MRVLAYACGSAALVFHAAVASAYCRTTTSQPPVGYDPVVNGCITAGKALAWHVARVPYSVASAASRQVSLSEATRVADLAFGAWNGAFCGGQAVGIRAYDAGPISVPAGRQGAALATWASCADSCSCSTQARDVIVFDDNSWPYDDPANTLALTTVTFGKDDGQIFDAYTEVNTAQHQITTEEPPPPGGEAYDLQAILTHEAGHFLGLAHSADTSAIMYAYYQPGAIDLTADDVGGICAMYQHGTQADPMTTACIDGSGSVPYCSCKVVGRGSGVPASAATLGLAALAWLRRRAGRPR